jgi:acyl-CoA synthetase (AMP-forming)/AMP-acid ligase II
LHEQFEKVLPNGTTYTPYGATECLPVASISGREIIEQGFKERVLEGTCVGKAVPGLEVKIIGASEKPIESLADCEVLTTGQIGEIICKGPQVTLSYFERPDATRKAKIYDSGEVWHRMGDLGWMDQEGRLWFCGRQAYAFSFEGRKFYSVLIEAVFNAHPDVFRSALVQLETLEGMRPAIAIERHDHKVKLSKTASLKLKNELYDLSHSTEKASKIKDFFLVKSFPVDARHNIKIDRTGLGKSISQGREGKLL